jgi:hypothetical protein
MFLGILAEIVKTIPPHATTSARRIDQATVSLGKVAFLWSSSLGLIYLIFMRIVLVANDTGSRAINVEQITFHIGTDKTVVDRGSSPLLSPNGRFGS